jgi:hypothetical protein
MTKSEALPPFSGDDTTCAKCGNKEAFTSYRERGTCLHDTAGGVYGFALNERLHRQCTHCDYAWDEATVTPAARPEGSST